MVIIGIEVEMISENIDAMLKMVLREKARREAINQGSVRKKKKNEEEKARTERLEKEEKE